MAMFIRSSRGIDLVRGMIVASVLAAAAVLAVVGCSASVPGNAGTSTVSASTAGSRGDGDLTVHGAPRVKNPLDYAKFEAAPCTVLTSTQLEVLNLAGVVGHEKSSAVAKACTFEDSSGSSGQHVAVSFVKGGGGLDYLYQSREDYKLFESISPVQGYPAILEAAVDSRSKGYCGLAVGITDQMVLSVDTQLRGGATPAPRYSDPCGVARDAAEQVMITLKG